MMRSVQMVGIVAVRCTDNCECGLSSSSSSSSFHAIAILLANTCACIDFQSGHEM
jgi:hypothetical protein